MESFRAENFPFSSFSPGIFISPLSFPREISSIPLSFPPPLFLCSSVFSLSPFYASIWKRPTKVHARHCFPLFLPSSPLSSLYLPLVLLRRESHEPRQAQRQWVRVKEEERAGCSSQTPRYRRRRTRFHGLNGRQHWFLARREEEPTSVLSTVVSRSRAGNFLPVSWLFAPFLPPFLSISISPRHNGRDSVIVHFLRVCNDRQIWPVDH